MICRSAGLTLALWKRALAMELLHRYTGLKQRMIAERV